MRLKQYYTADEIIINLYTFGKEWMNDDGVEYVGAYHKYITNEVYTESSWNPSLSVKLIAYEVQDPIVKAYKKIKNINTKYHHVNTHMVSINSSDIKKGSIARFFLQKQNDLSIIEINNASYDKWTMKQVDNNLYTAIKIDWYITGLEHDIKQNGITTPSVSTLNKKQVMAAEKNMPGISNVLSNYLEYYLNSDITTPKDINT
jgi:hypothetical protein